MGLLRERAKRVWIIVMTMCIFSLSIAEVSPTRVLATSKKMTTPAALRRSITKAMMARKTTFTIQYKGDVPAVSNQLSKIIKEASSENDYLQWSYYRVSSLVKGNAVSADFTFKINYITTSQQEKAIDKKIKKIMPKIIKSKMTKKEKVRVIHKYIVDNVKYDKKLVDRSAYTALYKGKAVCQGYALLLYRMLDNVGIPCRIVTGKLSGGLHAWNLVKIDGKWYHIDATNNDANSFEKYYMVTDSVLKKNKYTWEKTDFPKASVKYSEWVKKTKSK